MIDQTQRNYFTGGIRIIEQIDTAVFVAGNMRWAGILDIAQYNKRNFIGICLFSNMISGETKE